MIPKSSYAEDLVPNAAVCRGGAFRMGLHHESSYLMDRLIHLWSHSLMSYREIVEA
jgi:hypothetical protein